MFYFKLSKIPESPECYTTADVIRDEICGWYITNVRYTDLFKKNKENIDTELVQANLPLLLEQVIARGKRIIFVVTNSKGEDFAYVWFFAMTGSLSFVKKDHTQITFTVTKDGEKKHFYYEDKRTLGYAKFVTTGEELLDCFKNMGLDYMTGEVTLEMFTKEIKNKRRKNALIAAFLLSQKPYIGIGNYARAEILLEAKISPYRKLEDLSDDDIEILYNSIHKILQKAYKCGGLTIGDYFDPHGRPGRFKPKVYGRKDIPEVVHEPFGPKPKGKTDTRRTIWYNPEIQV